MNIIISFNIEGSFFYFTNAVMFIIRKIKLAQNIVTASAAAAKFIQKN
jgi:hypothetical protein